VANRLNGSRCFFWCEGYYRGRLFCVRWGSGSAYRKEDLPQGSGMRHDCYVICSLRTFAVFLCFELDQDNVKLNHQSKRLGHQSCSSKVTRAVQPVATCRQLPYSHYDVIFIMTSRADGARSPRFHYDVILIVTSFATQLATPTITDEPTLRTAYRV